MSRTTRSAGRLLCVPAVVVGLLTLGFTQYRHAAARPPR
jgi:hypothetical protein